MKFRQRVNEAIRALSLATAIGGDLDHIAATYAGISRLVYDNAADDQPFNSQWDDVLGKWVELDDIFRSRILLCVRSVFGRLGRKVHIHSMLLNWMAPAILQMSRFILRKMRRSIRLVMQYAYSMGLIPAPFTGRNTYILVLLQRY